jgi:hypothetical protein
MEGKLRIGAGEVVWETSRFGLVCASKASRLSATNPDANQTVS